MNRLYLSNLAGLVFVITSCGSPEDKPETKETREFSVRSIVKAFQGDSSIVEVKGIQTDLNLFYLEYFVYVGKKNRVLDGINVIIPQAVNDYTSDDRCYPVTPEEFYAKIAPGERSIETAFFWNFEKLASYEIYSCIKAPLRHFIIFDKQSDTIYHRVEELLD